MSENMDLKNLNLKHAKPSMIQKIFDQKSSLPLIVHA